MLFIASIATNLIAIMILFPVVANVNKAQVKVLSLFIDIPNHHVYALVNKCERFLNTFSLERTEEVDSDEEQLKVDETDFTTNTNIKKSGHKVPKNSAKSNRRFFINLGVGVCIIEFYFIAMYTLAIQYISNTENLTNEINICSQVESYYSFAFNV